ncbi:MAG: LamG-like jellyroll fold domain-containing protein [Bacteroidota bacterium]|nr:LamG-like jellyroll fold domain-containing protein [Bacteroidota bacterium]
MKKILFLFAVVLFSLQLFAQDTIVVQTFTFDSITTRRGVWQFPDSSQTFRKIIMSYTLKCDPATTQDGYNCGEWDYLTYTNVYDHTGVIDSNMMEHPKYKMVNTVLDTIDFLQNETWFVNQQYQDYLVVDSVISELDFGIGNSTDSFNLPGFGQSPEGRLQFFYSADSLLQSGFSAGEIDALKLKFTGNVQTIKNLCLKLKSVSGNQTENGFDNSGLTEVYKKTTDILSGWQIFMFNQAFLWDGVSDILFELSYTGKTQAEAIGLQGTATSGIQCVYSSESDHYININGENYVSVDIDNVAGAIDDEVTITFWQYGDPNIQPQSDYLFEAKNANNKRILSSHLPWNNGNVYWDAGHNGSSYDRIYKAANASEYAGKWNHWAMTKNTNTGNMFIYLNGQLWHQGSNKTKSMAGIEKFNIGANKGNGGFYDGYIDEFTVFNKELPDTTIQQYMERKVDTNHPFASNLLVSITFDEGSGYVAQDISGTGSNAVLMGSPEWGNLPGDKLRRNQINSNFLADIVLVRGEYLSHIESVISSDTIYNSPMSVVEYAVGNYEIVAVDTNWISLAGWQYVYDPTNQIIDSVYFSPTGEIINQTLIYYEEPYEVIDRYEIGRFITPYGIGLSLGPDGFTWLYDVTDYAHLLIGDVDISAGNQQELLDMKFMMIEGTPPRDIVELTRPWGQLSSKKYSALDNDDVLSNKRIALNSLASTFKMKTRMTGHGHNSSTGNYPHCCEWKDNTHYLLVNSDTVNQWHIWEAFDCAQNPVFPQGGTWPGSREGWCPGDKVKDYEFEITQYITGDSVDLDYEISDVPANNQGMGNGNYVIAMQFMQYGAANYNLDAEITAVISPNSFGYHSRKNPVCDGAEVVIRNSGATTLTSLEFEYSVAGGTSLQYTWTGNLEFMEKEIVNLPINTTDFWLGNGDNIFEVSISSPNNGSDEYADNNNYRTSFELPPIYDFNFIIMYNTNLLPGDNYYEVFDINGNIVQSRYTGSPNTTYYDTLNLPPGCYTMEFYDNGHDGLSYWAYPGQGTGSLRFKKIGGGTLIYFEAEFGYRIFQAFTLSENVSIHSSVEDQFIEVFPNPAKDQVFVDISGYSGKLKIQILDMLGKNIITKNIVVDLAATEKINISHLLPGIYTIKATGNDINYSKQLVVQ